MSFTYNTSTITARELTINEDDAVLRLRGMPPTDAIVSSWNSFCEFQVAAEVVGDWPAAHVTYISTPEQIAASYQVWIKLPLRFKKTWDREYGAANNLTYPLVAPTSTTG